MVDGTVASYMQVDFLILRPHLPMKQAVARLLESSRSEAPVIDDEGRLLGILTQKDCFASALYSAYYQQWAGIVALHMSENVETLDAATDIVSAAERFQTLPFRAFPVTRDDEVVGMLSRADLLAAFLALG